MGADSFKVFMTVTLPAHQGLVPLRTCHGLRAQHNRYLRDRSCSCTPQFLLITVQINEFAEKGSYSLACAFATILIIITYGAVLLMNLFIKHFGTSKQTQGGRLEPWKKQRKASVWSISPKYIRIPRPARTSMPCMIPRVDIEPGSFVTLLGPSGCGKTTTLRMIAGFESPDEGEIYLGEEPINELTPNKRDTAMVFQSYALLPHYNVFDNVAYGLKLRKMPKDEIRGARHAHPRPRGADRDGRRA